MNVRKLLLGRAAGSLFAGLAAFVLTTVPVLALLAAVGTFALPQLLAARKARIRRNVLRAAWPGVIDEAVSALRSGVSPEQALIEALQRLPEPTGAVARAMAADARATGRVGDALLWFSRSVDDPIVDRLIVVARLTQRLGSPDAVRVLEHLADSARDELRLHESIEARRSWINASAAMASAAPWVIAIGLSTRESARIAYSSPAGSLVLSAAAVCTAAAFILMRRIGRVAAPARLVMGR